jgi:DNA-binding MarR family transcriptional regulator
MAETFKKQLESLSEYKEVIENLRGWVVSEGGKLTPLGQDLVHSLIKHEMPNGEIAKLIGVTPSAISQQAKKLK